MDALATPSSLPDGFTLPAMFPPPGVQSNFKNPASRGKDLTIASALCISFMVVCVAVRFYTKLRIKNAWGWDDWLCIPATIGTIGFTATSLSRQLLNGADRDGVVLTLVVLGEGVGPHQWNVPFTAFTPSLLRRFVVLDMLYSPTILMAKLSLLILYLRIFKPNPRLRYSIYFTMLFLCLFYTATFVAYAVLSIPRPGQSQLESILSVNTAKDIPLGIAQGAVNVTTDFFIFCLPIPVVWNLQLPPKKKIGVMAIFMTGLLACIASAFGLYYRVHLGRNDDVTWKLVMVLLWVVVELTVGVTCSCLTSFPGFFRYHSPRIRSFVSVFSSSLKRLQYPSQQSRSSNAKPSSSSSSAKKLATKDVKVTLGSRIDGEGRFFTTDTSGSVFAPGEEAWPLPRAVYSPTRRDEYEESPHFSQPTDQIPQSFYQGPSQDSSLDHPVANESFGDKSQDPYRHWPPDQESREESRGGWRWWRRGDAGQTGYWDLMSIFRTRNTTLPVHTKASTGSEDSTF